VSIERQLLIRVRDFMKYWHPEVPRILPEAARTEYNHLHGMIDQVLEVKKPEPKKAAKKKVSKKK